MDSNFIKSEVDFFIENYTPGNGQSWVFFLICVIALGVFFFIYDSKKRKNKKFLLRDAIGVVVILLLGCSYSFYMLNLAPNVVTAKNLSEKNFCIVNTKVEDLKFETVERENEHNQMKLKGIKGYHKNFTFAGEFETYKIGDKAVAIIGQPCSERENFKSDYIIKIQHGEYLEDKYKKVFIGD